MTRPIVSHIVVDGAVPPVEAQMYEYLYGADGAYVRARREGLEACIRLAEYEARGLAPVSTSFALDGPRVPREIVRAIVAASETMMPKEALFYLALDGDRWDLTFPPQHATSASVRPTEPGGGAAYGRALVEVHSHHAMEARFSGTDDADETGFRLFAVVGSLSTAPQIRVRVGIYGHFWEIPAEWVFELPSGLDCAVEANERRWR